MQFNIFQSFVQQSVQAGDTISNVSGAPSYFATKYTITANTLVEGRIFQVSSGGTYGVAAAPTSTKLDLFLGIDRANINTGSRTPTSISAVAATWTCSYECIVQSIGVGTGSMVIHGFWALNNSDGDPLRDDLWVSTVDLLVGLDTTIDIPLELGVMYTASSVNNKITMDSLIVISGL